MLTQTSGPVAFRRLGQAKASGQQPICDPEEIHVVFAAH